MRYFTFSNCYIFVQFIYLFCLPILLNDDYFLLNNLLLKCYVVDLYSRNTMASRPTLAVARKSPLKSKKGVKKAPKQPWVETINDLDVHKPSKDMMETKKAQRKSQNKVLAKVNSYFRQYYCLIISQ